MSLIMMKTSQLSPLAFSLYKTYCPDGISAVAGLTQQQVQQSANLWNRQRYDTSFDYLQHQWFLLAIPDINPCLKKTV